MTFLVLGIDGATWKIIKPNIDSLPVFRGLLETCNTGTIHLKERPFSPSVWCGMFSGKKPEEHGHREYLENGKLQTREDIKVEFIWEILEREGFVAKALNVPFVFPPYNYNVEFRGIGFGLPITPDEWDCELRKVTEKTIELLGEEPHLLISVFTILDRIQHLHWGEPLVLEWYKKMDKSLGSILLDTGFLKNEKNRLVIISDHGFCSFEEARVNTFPKETIWRTVGGKTNVKIKGDHDENTILVKKNVKNEIKSPQDVFFAIKSCISRGENFIS